MASLYHPKRYMAMILAASVCLTSCVACGIEPCRVAMTDVDSGSWEDTATVRFDNTDTASLYDLSVVLHVSPSFDCEQVSLNVEILSPDSMRLTEDVTLATAVLEASDKASGRDVEAPYRRSVRLQSKGCYTISITPREPVVGVEAAGVTFQPVTK